MTYWHMSLYPNNNKDWNSELELLETKFLIGIGLNKEENNPQIEQFKKMEEGDIVLIKDRFQFALALVKIIGKNEEVEKIDNYLDWFVFRRKIEIITLDIKEKLDFRLPPARLSKSKDKTTNLYQFIDQIYKSNVQIIESTAIIEENTIPIEENTIPIEENMDLVNINEYMENFNLDIESLTKLIKEEKYVIDEINNIFYTELLEFYKNQLIEINSISVQIENVKSINKLCQNFRIDFNNKIYSIVGNNGIGKSALLVVLGQLVNQTYFSYEFKGNAYDDSKIIFIFNDIIKFEWKKYSTKTNTKRWSLETKNSLGDMPRINGFFESGIISGTRFENLGIKKQVLDIVERNSVLRHEDNDGKEIDFIKENLNYIINDKTDFNKYKSLFIAEVDIKIKGKIKKERKIFFKNNSQQIVSEYSFCTGEYFVVSLLKFIYQYIDVKKKSLIIIDEIDISLHPLAQRRLLEKIKEFSIYYKITFIIATHSLQIIENLKAENIYYFENNDGLITISNPIYPAYVTRNIYEHKYYDKVLLVEDILASEFLKLVIKKIDLTNILRTKLHYKIIEIGDWRKVLEVSRDNNRDKSYPNAEILAILDEDVSKSDAQGNKQANATKWDNIRKQYIPIEDNIEKYTVKKLLINPEFRKMVETDLISPNKFEDLLLSEKENNTNEIKNKFSKGNTSLVKQIFDKSSYSEEKIISRIISFIFDKLVNEEDIKYIKFENSLKTFLDLN